MMPSEKQKNLQTIDRWLNQRFLCCAIVCLLGTGCRQRAYTELYVENMASELRMLEDRIYDFDAANDSLEQDKVYLTQQVEELKRKYAELMKTQGMELTPGITSRKRSTPPLRLKGQTEPIESFEIPQRQGYESIPGETYQFPSVLIPDPVKSESVLNPPVRTPVAPPLAPSPLDKKQVAPYSGDLLPAPVLPSNPKVEPEASNRFPNRNPNLPAIENLTEQFKMPESMVRSAQQPKLMVVPAQPSPSQPFELPSTNPPKSNTLPSLLQRAFPKIKDGDPQSANQRGMIRLPEGAKVQFASANEPIAGREPMEIVDSKIVEIAFHPTMCRGHNFDDKPGDDGLYLVVTPVNATGQVMNKPGTLTVIVEDAAETKDNGRIAAWEITPEQLAETLEPIGAAQGFHLSLPWQGKLPTSKVVTVYLRYSDALGRTRVNQREVHLRTTTTEQQVWTPRKTTTSK